MPAHDFGPCRRGKGFHREDLGVRFVYTLEAPQAAIVWSNDAKLPTHSLTLSLSLTLSMYYTPRIAQYPLDT